MKAKILKIVAELKELVREMDDSGTTESFLDEIYDKLNQIEDEIYDDEDENY